MATLILGPLLRYVDDTSATIWLETDEPCTVEILGHEARTFHVGGHHYALVVVRDLRPGTRTPYDVRLDGQAAWPPADSPFPPSTIRTIPAGNDTSLRLLFGSCRFGHTEDPELGSVLGPDALDAYALLMTRRAAREWPDALLLLGDQIYADETTPEIQRTLAERRDLGEPPGTEVADFEEYTLLYRVAWSDPTLRWMLSTLPTMMIFDDHDIRDDWNTSGVWREQMVAQPWWPERLEGGLAAYWVYQHLGNLAPRTLDEDPTYREVLRAGRDGDALPVLRALAEQADREIGGHKGFRWSYARDLGPARLVVMDSRGGRILDSDERSMLSEPDFQWVEERATGEREHLVLGTSLPWLLPPVVHHVQAWNERISRARGPAGRFGEWLRQRADLEHWAAFRISFDRLARVVERASRIVPEPGHSTVTVLSGDVHHSYVADASFSQPHAPAVQVTCSPVHNTTPRGLDGPLRAAWSPLLARWARRLAGWAGVPGPPVRWSRTAGPFFGNVVGLLRLHGRHAEVSLERAEDDRGTWTVPYQRVLR